MFFGGHVIVGMTGENNKNRSDLAVLLVGLVSAGGIALYP